MEPVSLFLMAGGKTFEAIQNYRRLKKQKKSLKAQAAESLEQANYELRMGAERQVEFARQEDVDIGRSMAGTAGAGLRLGGSAAKRREAISTHYARAGEITRMETGERVRRLAIQAYVLRKRAKEAGRAAKWAKFTAILGGTATAAIGAHQLGMFEDLGSLFDSPFKSELRGAVKKTSSKATNVGVADFLKGMFS